MLVLEVKVLTLIFSLQCARMFERAVELQLADLKQRGHLDDTLVI